MAKPFPWFYAVNDRPVTIVELPAGGSDCLVFDFTTGNLVPDRSYFAHVAPGSGKDVDQLTADEFNRLVASRRVDIVRKWCERMCQVKTGSNEELAGLMGTPVQPPPLGAKQIDVAGDEIGIASLAIRLRRDTITRADVESRFGAGREMPRIDPRFPIAFAYEVSVEGAPHRCTLIASTVSADSREPTESVTSLTLRLDRGR